MTDTRHLSQNLLSAGEPMSASAIDAVSGQTNPSGILSAGSGLIFLFALAVSIPAGLFIQLVLLPIMMPGIHAGHGLVLGGDWIGFHADAVTLSEKIAHDGWRNFELRPRGQAPIGIAAAVYALTGIREPWILVPLHGAVFAVAVTGLFNIYRLITGTAFAAAAAAGLVLFPSSVLFYAQIHKDVWSIAGNLWLFFVLVSYATLRKISLRQHATLLVITMFAVTSVWLVRAYVLQVLLVGILIALVVLAILTILTTRYRSYRREMSRWIGVLLCTFVVVAVAFELPTRIVGIVSPGISAFISPPNVLEGDRPVFMPFIVPPSLSSTFDINQRELAAKQKEAEFVKTLTPEQMTIWSDWEAYVRRVVEGLTPDQSDITWVPRGLRHRLETIINLRRGQIISSLAAGSAIDNDAQIRNAADMFRYIPRAMQIALFAPFPDMWFKPGVSPGAGAMRTVAALEMIGSYLSLAGFVPLLLLADARQRKVVVFACAFVLPILCLLAITIPNVGTLYRMRYGFFYLLVGFGIVGWAFAIYRIRRAGQHLSNCGSISRPTLSGTES